MNWHLLHLCQVEDEGLLVFWMGFFGWGFIGGFEWVVLFLFFFERILASLAHHVFK